MKKKHELFIAEDDHLLLKILKERFSQEYCNVTGITAKYLVKSGASLDDIARETCLVCHGKKA
ncbi:hypothetical protein JXA05_01090 [Candidatus Peregrinibacteria bacterium]|nr:hypothetical protein [Candidatus Peregrinibacteria bacterium]